MQSFFTMTTKSSKLQGMFFIKRSLQKMYKLRSPGTKRLCQVARSSDFAEDRRPEGNIQIQEVRFFSGALETTRRIDTVYYPSGAKTDLKPERSVVFIRSSKLHFQWSSRSRNTRKIDTAYCHSGAAKRARSQRGQQFCSLVDYF